MISRGVGMGPVPAPARFVDAAATPSGTATSQIDVRGWRSASSRGSATIAIASPSGRHANASTPQARSVSRRGTAPSEAATTWQLPAPVQVPGLVPAVVEGRHATGARFRGVLVTGLRNRPDDEAMRVRPRTEGDLPASGRPRDVHGRQLPERRANGFATSEIEDPEVVAVPGRCRAGERDACPIGRDPRLHVADGPGRQPVRLGSVDVQGHEPQVRDVLLALDGPAGHDGEGAVRGEIVLLEDDLLAEGLGGGEPGCPATRRGHGARLESRTRPRTGRITRRTLTA